MNRTCLLSLSQRNMGVILVKGYKNLKKNRKRYYTVMTYLFFLLCFSLVSKSDHFSRRRSLQKGLLYHDSELLHEKNVISSKIFIVILKCALDEQSESLQVSLPFSVFESFTALMAIIISRCQTLKKLTVIFRFNFKKSRGLRKYRKRTKDLSQYTTPPGSQLPSLESLTLLLDWSCNCRDTM